MSTKSEANSLEEVKRRLEGIIKKEKASLINAPTSMAPNKTGGNSAKGAKPL